MIEILWSIVEEVRDILAGADAEVDIDLREIGGEIYLVAKRGEGEEVRFLLSA